MFYVIGIYLLIGITLNQFFRRFRSHEIVDDLFITFLWPTIFVIVLGSSMLHAFNYDEEVYLDDEDDDAPQGD